MMQFISKIIKFYINNFSFCITCLESKTNYFPMHKEKFAMYVSEDQEAKSIVPRTTLKTIKNYLDKRVFWTVSTKFCIKLCNSLSDRKHYIIILINNRLHRYNTAFSNISSNNCKHSIIFDIYPCAELLKTILINGFS